MTLVWDMSKPVPVLYFYRAPLMPLILLLPYTPRGGGWGL